jgi:HEAT repeat protein
MRQFFLMLLACLTCRVAGAEPVSDVNQWIRGLRSVKYEERVRAAESLGRMGASAAPAVRALAAALSDQQFEVQAEAMIALERIGPAARGAVPELIEALQGENGNLFGFAINALGAIGSSAAPAKPELVRFMSGENRQLAIAACRSLWRILPPDDDQLVKSIAVLLAALQAPDEQLAQDAVDALGLCGRAVVPDLVKVVENHATSAAPAARAAAALRLVGHHARPAVAALVGALTSRNESVVEEAIDALGAIGAAAGPGVPALRALLESPTASIRTHAASTLGDIGVAAATAVEDLALALEDRDEGVRREAAQALGKIGLPAKAAIPMLIRALDDKSDAVKWHVAEALSRMGEDVVAPLAEMLHDNHVRFAAVVILGDLGPAAHAAVRPLLELLSTKEHSADLEREILLALSRIGPAAKEAVPALLAILADEKGPTRAAAAWALARIGAKEAVPQLIGAFPKTADSDLAIAIPIAVLTLDPDDDEHMDWARQRTIELLSHDSSAVRQEAAKALSAVAPKATKAVPKLTAGLSDPDPAVRTAFLTTLAAIGPDSATALPAISKALDDPVAPVRYAAIHAVGILGPAAKSTAERLAQNLKDEDAILQFVSAWSLVRVDPRREKLADECLAPLLRGVNHGDPHVRGEAARTLGLLGPAGKKAVPELDALTRDADETVRKSARDALQKIAPSK